MKTRVSGFVLGFLVVMILPGCLWGVFHSKPAQPTGNLNPIAALGTTTDAATQKADSASATELEKIKTTASKLRANVDQARTANTGNPPGPARTTTDLELEVAQTRLKDVVPDPTEVAAGQARKALIDQGKIEEARAAYLAANAEALRLSNELITARTEAAVALKERDAAREAERAREKQLADELEVNRKANQKQLDDLRDGILRQQVWYLNIAGALCFVVFALAAGFGGLLGVKKAAPLLVIAVLCFGLAQIVGQAWFKWAVLITTVLGAGVAAWWVWKQHQDGKLTEALKVKADQATKVVKDVVPVLDKAYENGTKETKELLDQLIFDKLGNKMDASTKAAVHAARAEMATEAKVAV